MYSSPAWGFPQIIVLAVGSLALALTACSVGLAPVPPGSDSATVEVTSELGAKLGRTSHFRLTSSRPINKASAWVLRGELSSYALGQIRRDEAAQSLLDRRVPSLNWTDSDGVLNVAPLEPLSGMISVVETGNGVLFQGMVESSAQGLMRVWPPAGQVASNAAMFCLDDTSELGTTEIDALDLLPSGEALGVLRGLPLGLRLERCITLFPKAVPRNSPSPFGISPVSLFGVALDPTVFDVRVASAWGTEAPCTPHQLALPAGCATVGDDRVTFTFDRPVHVAVKVGAAEKDQALAAGQSLSIPGLLSETAYPLQVAVTDLAGESRIAEGTVTTTHAAARVVINEVLANPKGPEPAQEWIELYNDGRAPADLSGFTLEDNGGVSNLPNAVLAPGAYALLVNEGFDPANTADVLPLSDTQLLRIPKLGTNGLSNSGEPLKLKDASGQVVSNFIAQVQAPSGVSVCRAAPGSDGPTAFVLHAEPGASPGVPNVPSSAPQ